MDIIDEYVSSLKANLDAPEVFIQASAYHIVSSLLGRFFTCQYVGDVEKGMRPNTWFIISSIPGRTRRSTVSSHANYIYKKCLNGYLMEKHSMEKKDAGLRVYDTIIEEGTVEGIMDHIHNNKEINEYTILSSEFGSVLTRMSTKEYQTGVSSILSKLYSGEGGSIMLSQRGKDARGRRRIPDGLYVTMFAGMQEPHYYLTPIMIRQGLLRRIILIFCEPSDIEKWLKPIDFERSKFRERLDPMIIEIKERMNDYYDGAQHELPPYIKSYFHGSSEKDINEYAERNDRMLDRDVSDVNIYRQSLWEHIAKISMLHAISRDNVKSDIESPENFYLDIEKEDVKKAITFIEDATKYSADIISNLSRLDTPIQSDKLPIERVLAIISERGEISRTELARRTQMVARVLNDYISALLIQDKIEMVEKPTGGKTAIFYRLKTY